MEKNLMELCENLEKTAEALLIFVKDLTVYLKEKDNPPPRIKPELDCENDPKTSKPKKSRLMRTGYTPQYLLAITHKNNDWILKRLREWGVPFKGSHRSRKYLLTQDELKRLTEEATK